MERNEKNKGRFSKPSPDSDRRQNKSGKESVPTFLKFTGVAFEMLATIGLGTVGGYFIDKYLGLEFPAFLLSLAMLSLFASLYLLYKRLPKE